MVPVEDPTKDSGEQTHNGGNLKIHTELDTTVAILTTSDRRALLKANGLRALSSISSSKHSSSPANTVSPTIDFSKHPLHKQPRRHRVSNSNMASNPLDARPGPLGVTIAHIHAAVKQAYNSGGKGLKLSAGDEVILEREFPGLGGCSRYAYNIILSPLMNVQDMLKGIEDDLENLAFKAKRMAAQKGVIRTYHCPYQQISLHILTPAVREHLPQRNPRSSP